MKQYVIGDIHGAYRAIIQCFERSGFDYEQDKLICLGDIVDGYPEVYESVEELLKVKTLIYILGNHDRWSLEWALHGVTPHIWTSQGGLNTIKSYEQHGGKMSESHITLFDTAALTYVENNKLFVHGGIDPNLPLGKQDINTLLWDRDLIRLAKMKGHNRDYKLTSFDDIFVGHTTTQLYSNELKPLHYCEVWGLDTGAGWSGKLTIMDVDSKEYWQSDVVTDLYPDIKGRGE